MTFNAVFLHGLMQNAKIIAKESASIKKGLSKILNITYLDAPYVLDTYPVFCQVKNSKTDEDLRKMENLFRANYYKKNGKKDTYERTWYFTEAEGTYSPQLRDVPIIGLEDSLNFILQECKKNQYDGLVGFSQGSLISSILTKKLLGDPAAAWKPKFCLLFSAPMPYTLTLSQLLTTGPKIDVPSLHVMGRNDKLVPNERSLLLSECYRNPSVHYHDGAHFVPDNDDLSVYENFFRRLEG